MVKRYRREHSRSTDNKDAFNILVRRIDGAKYQAILTCEVDRRVPDQHFTATKIDIAAIGEPAGSPNVPAVELALLNLLAVTSDCVAGYLILANPGTREMLGAQVGGYIDPDVYDVKLV